MEEESSWRFCLSSTSSFVAFGLTQFMKVFLTSRLLCVSCHGLYIACGEGLISPYRWARETLCSKFTVDRFSRPGIILHASAGIDFYYRPEKNHFNANIIPRTNLQLSAELWLLQAVSSTLPHICQETFQRVCEV